LQVEIPSKTRHSKDGVTAVGHSKQDHIRALCALQILRDAHALKDHVLGESFTIPDSGTYLSFQAAAGIITIKKLSVSRIRCIKLQITATWERRPAIRWHALGKGKWPLAGLDDRDRYERFDNRRSRVRGPASVMSSSSLCSNHDLNCDSDQDQFSGEEVRDEELGRKIVVDERYCLEERRRGASSASGLVLNDDLVADIERFAAYAERLRRSLDSSTSVPENRRPNKPRPHTHFGVESRRGIDVRICALGAFDGIAVSAGSAGSLPNIQNLTVYTEVQTRGLACYDSSMLTNHIEKYDKKSTMKPSSSLALQMSKLNVNFHAISFARREPLRRPNTITPKFSTATLGRKTRNR
uniref:Uncharacterized protein n=1 Tax=Parascaris equorum TaxID=6256 RepID=A0A914S373_PAREQ